MLRRRGSALAALAGALGVLALGIIVGVLVLIRYGLRPLHEIQGKLGDVRAGRRSARALFVLTSRRRSRRSARRRCARR